jgi:hypothetical protein
MNESIVTQAIPASEIKVVSVFKHHAMNSYGRFEV